MLETAEIVTFLPSRDLLRSEHFYVDVLGLTVLSRSSFASVLKAGGVKVRVTKVEELSPQPFTVLGWVVTDVRAKVQELSARGTDVLRYDGLGQDATGVWETPGGDLVVWFHDPDANVLSMTELRSA